MGTVRGSGTATGHVAFSWDCTTVVGDEEMTFPGPLYQLVQLELQWLLLLLQTHATEIPFGFLS